MAPTEILSEQHYRKFDDWFGPLGLRVAWLHGGLSKSEKKKTLDGIRNKDSLIVIGTHALVQEGVEFDRLGLAAVDEQHRFGVQQPLTPRRNSHENFPHPLSLTSPPLPPPPSTTPSPH